MKNKKNNLSIERAYDIIKKPITTEKSTNLQQFNQYSFEVARDSNSFEIKKAIETIFKVKVNLSQTDSGRKMRKSPIPSTMDKIKINQNSCSKESFEKMRQVMNNNPGPQSNFGSNMNIVENRLMESYAKLQDSPAMNSKF